MCYQTILTVKPGIIKQEKLYHSKWAQLTQRVSQNKAAPLAFSPGDADWYDSSPIQTANFTHDWDSMGCNKIAFLNIALEWLCDYQHNSCHSSLGPWTPIWTKPGSTVLLLQNSKWTHDFGLFVRTHVTHNSRVLIERHIHCRFMESVNGHMRLPEEAVQGPVPVQELWLGNFWLL